MDQAKSQYATSLGLLQDLQAGEDSGWRKFVHLYTPLIFAWARKGGLQEADAADVCQEVFRQVSGSIKTLDFERPDRNFRGWLWTITRRALARYYGKEAKAPNAAGGTTAVRKLGQIPDWIDDEEAPETPSADAEVMLHAAEIIKGDFEEHTWLAFWMSAVEEQQASDIAEKLGMTRNAVRQAKFRVLTRLKEFVNV